MGFHIKTVFSPCNNKVGNPLFNLCSALDCPSRKLGLCQLEDPEKDCYGRNPEKRFPKTCLPYRNRQAKYWQAIDAKNFCWRFLSRFPNAEKLRISEVGDFGNYTELDSDIEAGNTERIVAKGQEDLDKVSEIAEILSAYNITTYCYTARSDLDYSKRGKLVVNGSDFLVDNNFTIDATNADYTCPGDCRKCSICTKKTGLLISVPKH